MNSVLTTEKLFNHKGHKIVIVGYGGENISLECETCNELLADSDIEPNRIKIIDKRGTK